MHRMTLYFFLSTYDYAGSIVLLEGKRHVLPQDKAQLVALGQLLAGRTQFLSFRSGNAEGADELFCQGVSQIDAQRLQVITPYDGHRMRSNVATEVYPLDQVNLLQEPQVVYNSKLNRKTANLIDIYVAGRRDRYTIKAAYILRDTIKVIGTKAIAPATVGIFYDDLVSPRSGGTGHTMNICDNNQVPVLNQEVWFSWLNS